MTSHHDHTARSTNTLKRPDHPSPVASFDRTRSRSSGVIKRARWDVSSPIPSPPVLSVTQQPPKNEPSAFSFASSSSAFHFQLSPKPKLSSTAHRNRHLVEPHVHSGSDDDDDEQQYRTAAFSRLRASARNDGELFVERMREWEEKQQPDQQLPLTQGPLRNSPLPFTAFGQTIINHSHDHGGSSYNLGHSVPSLSHSAFTASSSGSGSDSFSRRKRSWSVVEDDEDDTAADEGYEMDWEMVKRSKVDASHSAGILPSEDGDVDFMAPSSSSSQQGDVESAMEDDEMEDDDDDELIFVLNHQDQPSPSREPQFTSNVSADRMISELSQILDAGAGDINGSSRLTSRDRAIDAGAFWE
ncbi:hypothetical protein FRC03_008392 [Tulasnella sp. 419]|nr:hypothetical protein FRC03_008392 [Tulasnella sp. 419]